MIIILGTFYKFITDRFHCMPYGTDATSQIDRCLLVKDVLMHAIFSFIGILSFFSKVENVLAPYGITFWRYMESVLVERRGCPFLGGSFNRGSIV